MLGWSLLELSKASLRPQALPWQLPVYLDHRFIFLDNTQDCPACVDETGRRCLSTFLQMVTCWQDFGSQLYSHGQCEAMAAEGVLVHGPLSFRTCPGGWPALRRRAAAAGLMLLR